MELPCAAASADNFTIIYMEYCFLIVSKYGTHLSLFASSCVFIVESTIMLQDLVQRLLTPILNAPVVRVKV